MIFDGKIYILYLLFYSQDIYIMGGGYYDRDVVAGSSDGVVGSTYSLNPGLDPKSFTPKQSRIKCESQNPIVFALDVTGSMGEWPKIIYDKFPMFYGQIMIKNYLNQPAISFCAIGDAIYDQAPLQVTDFGQGKQIDQLIAKMWLEGGGGGNAHQSYELAAYFYNRYVQIPEAKLPFFFVTGDQAFFDQPQSTVYEKVLGEKPQGKIVHAKGQWKSIKQKYNTFLLKKKYNSSDQPQIHKQWVDALGKERVLPVQTPKACIDVILGVIAITSGVRNLQTYVQDMVERGQDQTRIKEVRNALKLYSEALKSKHIVPVKGAGFNKHINENDHKSNLKKMKEDLKEKVSEVYLCPITKEIFIDPVMTADGITFERNAILEWFKSNDTSPVTKEVLENKNLIPNLMVKKLIDELYAKYSSDHK